MDFRCECKSFITFFFSFKTISRLFIPRTCSYKKICCIAVFQYNVQTRALFVSIISYILLLVKSYFGDEGALYYDESYPHGGGGPRRPAVNKQGPASTSPNAARRSKNSKQPKSPNEMMKLFNYWVHTHVFFFLFLVVVLY